MAWLRVKYHVPRSAQASPNLIPLSSRRTVNTCFKEFLPVLGGRIKRGYRQENIFLIFFSFREEYFSWHKNFFTPETDKNSLDQSLKMIGLMIVSCAASPRSALFSSLWSVIA